MASVKADFSDVDRFFSDGMSEVVALEGRIGHEAVAYAKAHGSYTDRTGRLRRSNEYTASRDGLMLFNGTPYASNVEGRGYEVLSGAALFAERRLREETE